MMYYRLATIVGYGLMAAAIVSFGFYLAALIVVSSYMGDGPIYTTMVGCLIGGIFFLQTRALFTASVAERLTREGEATTAQVLSVVIFGERDMDEEEFADWYRLIVRLAPFPGMEQGRHLYIEQLFQKRAGDWLVPGVTVPVRYSRSMGVALVEHEDAFPRLHVGRQFWPMSALIRFSLRRDGIG